MPNELITIATYSTAIEANIAKAKLESAEIAAYVQDENLVNINFMFSQAMGGVRLQVEEQDAEEAKKILADVTGSFHFEEEAPSQEVAKDTKEDECPFCHSKKISYKKETQHFFTALFSFLFMILIPFYKKKLNCYDCGKQWKPS